MGTKRPNRTPFDTLSNQKATDRHHLPDGRIAGENGQRQGTSAPSERGRGRIREEEQRGVREMERMKDKLRDKGKAIESLERYSGREVAPASRTREGERKWRERDKRQLEERLRNGRPVSNVESRTEHGIEREVEKGGTFPRMRNGSKERAEIMTALIEQEMERGGKAFIERHKRLEFDDWEMERVRERTRRTERQGDREYLKERERERDGTRRRPREEGKTNRGVRTREDGTRPQNERLRDSDPGFWETRREKDMEVNDLRDKRERDIARERERSRPGIGERERRMPSPRRRDREGYSEREVWEKPKRRDGKRGTKSEGDSDGGMRKGRGREGEREEWIYRHSRSEGDSIEQTKKKGREELRYSEDERMRYREKQRHRDAEGPRRRGQDGETSSERDWQFHRERDRRKHGGCEEEKGCRDGVRDIKGCRPDEGQRTCDRREAKRYREREDEERRYRERVDEEKRCREKRERRTDCRRYDATGGVGQSLSETAPKAAPQGQSSGEWSSDRDDENSQTRRSDSYEERESDKESTGESDQDVVHERSKPEKNEKVHKTSEKYEGVEDRLGERRGPVPEQRRMWLEPQRGKCSIESSLEDKFTEGGTHNRQKDRNMGQERGIESGKNCGRESLRESEEQHGRFSDQTQSSGSQQIDRCSRKGRYVEQTVDPGGEIEGVSVDEEGESGAWLREGGREVKEPPLTGSVKCPRPLKQENVKDNIEESDREGGSDYCTRSESEGGSETGWDHGRDRGLSGEDGFVTVSSGGDEEEEEREEDEFEDCRDFWEGGDVNCDTQPVVLKGHEGEMEKHNKQIEEFMVEEENRGQEKGKPPKYVFCVIGQTLPDSKPNNLSEMYQLEIVKANEPGSSQHRSDEIAAQPQIDMHPVLSSCTEYSVSDNQQEETRTELDKDASASDERSSTNGTPEMDSREKQRSVSMEISMENPYAEIGPVNRDAQTEQLLIEWREKNRAHKELTESYIEQLSPGITNPYDDAGLPKNSVPIPTTQDGAIPQTIDPDEEVSIQIRMSGAWSMEEEAKRRSQAPHLKWAKNVVTEILGPSEEHVIDDSALRSQESRQNVNVSEGGLKTHELKGTMAEGMEELPVYATVQKSRSPDRVSVMEVDEGEAEPLELEELRDNEDSISESWGEVDLRNVLDTVGRRKRNSKFFNAAPLYQQYSEEAQNIEILRQSRSDVLSTHEDQAPRLPDPLPSCPPSSSLAPCPAPACRPLPPLPPNPHPHSLSLTGSISNKHSRANTLPLPEPPKSVQRPHSPRLSISLGQSATLWQDLPGVRSSVELDQLSEDQRRLQEVRFEVVTSEASYCRSLDIVVEHFVKSKQLGVLLTTQDRNWLFSRLADVRAISHSFLSKLEEKVESDMIHFTVCDVIAHYCQRFKMVYVPYLTNQSYQDATYQSLMNENPRFKRIVEKLERSPVCQRLPLRSFLILPFQRITRIKLLVQNIVKRTAPATEEVMQAIKALKLLEKMIQESNDSISQMKSIESLVSLSAMVDFECRTLPLVSQSRRLVREGPVTELMEFSVKDTERQIYLHLFNDYLLLSLHKEGGRFTVIDHSPVSDLRAENCRVKLHSLQKNLFRLHLAQKALLLRNDTQSDKLRWISAISRPHPEVDFSAAQDFTQMQCIRAIVAQQPDELSLEKADVILVHQQSSDGWVEGTKLSDRQRGWMPASHLETITNSRVCQRNLSDALKLTTATAAV